MGAIGRIGLAGKILSNKAFCTYCYSNKYCAYSVPSEKKIIINTNHSDSQARTLSEVGGIFLHEGRTMIKNLQVRSGWLRDSAVINAIVVWMVRGEKI